MLIVIMGCIYRVLVGLQAFLAQFQVTTTSHRIQTPKPTSITASVKCVKLDELIFGLRMMGESCREGRRRTFPAFSKTGIKFLYDPPFYFGYTKLKELIPLMLELYSVLSFNKEDLNYPLYNGKIPWKGLEIKNLLLRGMTSVKVLRLK